MLLPSNVEFVTEPFEKPPLNSIAPPAVGAALLLKVEPVNGSLKLTGTLPVPPRISLSVRAQIDVSGSAITLRPVGVAAALAKIPGIRVAAGIVEQALTVRLPISELPFGIELQRATVTPAGVLITASASGLTIRAPSS